MHHKMQRLAILKMMLGLVRMAHKRNFPHKRLGRDTLELLFVIGVVHNAPTAGRKATIGYVSKELELPRETTRRMLNKLVSSGRLQKQGRIYSCNSMFESHDAMQEAVELIKKTASKL